MHNKIYIFWNIGKSVYENENNYLNIIEKYSDYYSYYYGNSFLFTRENIRLMKKFYLTFPIFYFDLERLSWEQYKLLFLINNYKERYFYFYISLFFNYDYLETKSLIINNCYKRI